MQLLPTSVSRHEQSLLHLFVAEVGGAGDCYMHVQILGRLTGYLALPPLDSVRRNTFYKLGYHQA